MNNDFKKSSYLLTIFFFFIGIIALVSVSAAKYFAFDDLVVAISQIAALASFFIMFINCIYTKSRYNSACLRFAEYILNNRRKESERKAADAERAREMENIREAAEHDREKAVAAALQQGRNEGAQSANLSAQQNMPVAQQNMPYPQQNVPYPQQVAVPTPRMPYPQPGMPMQRTPYPQPEAPAQQRVSYPQQAAVPAPQQARQTPAPRQSLIAPDNEEVLYNEYGEPVMVRRRVRKTSGSPDGELLYDGSGNPVIRRNQGLWEPLEQRHEIVVKVETSPGVTVSQPAGQTGSDRGEADQ